MLDKQHGLEGMFRTEDNEPIALALRRCDCDACVNGTWIVFS